MNNRVFMVLTLLLVILVIFSSNVIKADNNLLLEDFEDEYYKEDLTVFKIDDDDCNCSNIGVYILNITQGFKCEPLARTSVFYLDDDSVVSSTVINDIFLSLEDDRMKYHYITGDNTPSFCGTTTIQMTSGTLNISDTYLNISMTSDFIDKKGI